VMPHLSLSRLCSQISPLLVLAASLLGPSVTAFSAEVRLAWDAPTQPGLAGYKIYYGIASKSDVTRIDVGNVTTYTVTGLKTNTTYNFCVTSYYTSGNESICSNQVSANLLPRMYGFSHRERIVAATMISQPDHLSETTAKAPYPNRSVYRASFKAAQRPLRSKNCLTSSERPGFA
jgi:Fibronectin type III domain